MGRHSRKGPAAPVADTGQREAVGPGQGTGRRRRAEGQQPPRTPQPPRPYDPQGPTTPGGGHDAPPQGTPAHGTPAYGTPAHGTPVYGNPPYGTPAHGTPTYGTPAHGTPRHRAPDQGTPSYGTPAQGTPAYGTPPHGTPAYETPSHGTPAHGTPSYASRNRGPQAPAAPLRDTPTHGTPRYQGPYDPTAAGASVRGGHPVHDEGAPPPPAAPYIPGPRRAPAPAEAVDETGERSPDGPPDERKPAKPSGAGRTLTGIAAAAITTVLAVVVAGQVAEGETGGGPRPQAADGPADRVGAESPASRSDDRVTPAKPVPAAPPSYEQLMARQFPVDPGLRGSGRFDAVPGFDKAPGAGRKVRYRVDVEQGLGLDGGLFAQAVQKTLNDRRSWAGNGAMTFERISSGEPEFVITLASPGTTGEWCAKSGLDTTIDNVSCDSASTQRVMINAFRWAQGSETFGPRAMLAYRQMLINHEVGHRLGHSHVTCRTPGALAPVMQQQTKSLDIDGVKCRPNPWVHPGS
ncbi:DUF3152 domain-containing protein [Streptomyces sp. NPDC012769]|uniref:DUF3152 domain-containing protein n=1 Tax=Streptomyces sp. NPDC012769 TaxID=3364848 RepID=UPI0036931FE7